MAASPPSRSPRAPGRDWEDSYFNLDSRYRQLQKRLNEQEEELKQAKVAQRKTQGQEARRLGSSVTGTPQAGTGRQRSVGGRGGFTAQTTGPQGGHVPPRPSSPSDSHEFVSVPPSVARTTADPRASALHTASLLGSDPGALLPDPAMIWGAEGSVQNYVAANALYHANEELRRKLDESSTLVQALQQELSSTRTLCTNAQARVEDLAQQMHQLVRERDLATQKLATAKQSINDFERTIQSRTSDEEKVRFSLESQIAELRSRLVVGADSNELLTRDVRALLSEAKEKTGEVASLRSKLALAEAGLSSQRSTNESLLLELRNLNTQLIEERKRLLIAAREVQVAALTRDRVVDLEGQVRRLGDERAAMEGEHSRLMGDFVRVTEDALRHAREEVRADLEDWRAAAQHWEEVSQLLYKDVTQHTQAHIRCRAECDEAKAQRDLVAMELRATKEEIALCRAKLEVVWPTHARDAEGLTADDVLETFRRRRATFGDNDSPAAAAADGSDGAAAAGGRRPSGATATYAEALGELPVDSTTATERVYELQEANAALVAELEQLHLTNDMLQERVHAVTGKQESEAERQRAVARVTKGREKAGQRVLAQQLERVQFLEAQVHSLRGYQVSPSTGVQDVGPTENVLELFLGQLVGAEVPAGVDVPEAFSQLFCSADFLLHETVTTPTITGLNGFFDTTMSFCISMDALLLYYLQTRQLLVQLHRVRGADEVQAVVAAHDAAAAVAEQQPTQTPKDAGAPPSSSTGTTSRDRSLALAEQMFETVAEGEVSLVDLVATAACLNAARPTLKGHVKLWIPSGRHIASLEFQLTARVPFTEGFKALVHAALAATDSAAAAAVAADGAEEADTGRSPDPRAVGSGGGHGGPATSGMHEWLRRSSSTSSSASSRARPGGPVHQHHHHRRQQPQAEARRRREHDEQPAADRMQLVAGAGGWQSATGTSSLDSSSLSVAPDVQRRGGSAGRDVVRMALRGGTPTQGSNISRDNKGDKNSASHHQTMGLTHIPRSLLVGGPAPPTGGFSLQQQPWQSIHSVAVDVVRLELPGDLPMPIPRLSCFYPLSSLGREVRLPAPPRPQYTVEYEQPDPAFGSVFSVGSLTALSALAREPLTFFLIDEDAPPGTHGVWAMALCEWTQVLAAPEEPQTFTLPLLQQYRRSDGREERSLVRGGVLRVRLVVSAEATPHRRGDVPQADTLLMHTPQQHQEKRVARTSAGEPQRVAGRASPAQQQTQKAQLSPSPLSALQQLMQQVRQRGGAGHDGNAAALPTAQPAEAAPPPQSPSRQQTEQPSMDEELMRLELARVSNRWP